MDIGFMRLKLLINIAITFSTIAIVGCGNRSVSTSASQNRENARTQPTQKMWRDEAVQDAARELGHTNNLEFFRWENGIIEGWADLEVNGTQKKIPINIDHEFYDYIVEMSDGKLPSAGQFSGTIILTRTAPSELEGDTDPYTVYEHTVIIKTSYRTSMETLHTISHSEEIKGRLRFRRQGAHGSVISSTFGSNFVLDAVHGYNREGEKEQIKWLELRLTDPKAPGIPTKLDAEQYVGPKVDLHGFQNE